MHIKQLGWLAWRNHSTNKISFIIAIIIFSEWSCWSWKEVGGQKQPKQHLSHMLESHSMPWYWAYGVLGLWPREVSIFGQEYGGCILVLAGGGMTANRMRSEGTMWFHPTWEQNLLLSNFLKNKTLLGNSWDRIMRYKHCSNRNRITHLRKHCDAFLTLYK